MANQLAAVTEDFQIEQFALVVWFFGEQVRGRVSQRRGEIRDELFLSSLFGNHITIVTLEIVHVEFLFQPRHARGFSVSDSLAVLWSQPFCFVVAELELG